MPAIAEQLFKELYDEYIEIPFIGIIHKYYSEVGFLLLSYMCEKIDYDTFMDKLLSTKVVSNQEPMNREILKEMIATGDKCITRVTVTKTIIDRLVAYQSILVCWHSGILLSKQLIDYHISVHDE